MFGAPAGVRTSGGHASGADSAANACESTAVVNRRCMPRSTRPMQVCFQRITDLTKSGVLLLKRLCSAAFVQHNLFDASQVDRASALSWRVVDQKPLPRIRVHP